MATPMSIPAITAIVATAVALGAGPDTASAQSIQQRTKQAADSFQQSHFDEALAALESARSAAVQADPSAVPTIDFNRAAVMLAQGRDDEAQRILKQVDASVPAGSLRADARYNLGQIEARAAEKVVESDPRAAIARLRTAERFFRNALADQPGDADCARNIEIVQRRRAELMKKQEEQQKEQQSQNPQRSKDQRSKSPNNPSDQQPKAEGPDDQKNGSESPQQPPQNDQSEQQHSQDQGERQPPKQDQPAQQPGEQPEQQQQPQPQAADSKKSESQNQPQQSPQQQQADADKPDAQNPEQSESSQKPSPGGPDQAHKDAREFDVTAAQILAKERQKREELRRMFQMMRARAARVEKDW